MTGDSSHGLGPGSTTSSVSGGGAVPDDVMSDSRADAVRVLVIWVLRRTFWPLLLLGFAYAWLAGEVNPVALVRLDDPVRLFQALFTPLAGIVVAIGFRVVVDLVSLAVAWPRTRWVVADRARQDGHARGPVRRWVDRFYMTTAYRELRSTWTVRGRAVTGLGHSSLWLTSLNLLLWLLTLLAAAVLLLAVAETSGMGAFRLAELVGLRPGPAV